MLLDMRLRCTMLVPSDDNVAAEMAAAACDEKPMVILQLGFSCGEILCSLSHHGVLAHRLTLVV